MDTTIAPKSGMNKMIWLLILILVAAGIAANSYFGEVAWSLRLAGWIILACGVLGLVALTAQGKRLWAFSKEARVELYKVVWPTKDETIKMTLVVALLVIIMSLILWGVDSVLLYVVSLLTK